MRPVREEGGEPTALFLDHRAAYTLIDEVARGAGTSTIKLDWYKDTENIQVADGPGFLDFVESATFTPAWYLDNCDDVDVDKLSALIANMKALAPQWRESIGSCGELTFYVD